MDSKPYVLVKQANNKFISKSFGDIWARFCQQCAERVGVDISLKIL